MPDKYFAEYVSEDNFNKCTCKCNKLLDLLLLSKNSVMLILCKLETPKVVQ